jgi:phage terminase large subunit-like protein
MDNFRITLFRKDLIAAGFDVDDKNRVMLMKRVTQMRYAPVIQSAFINHMIAWGDNPLMRWFTNNTLADIDKQGNIVFGKKNAKYRMTDGFMALAAAFGASAELVEQPNIEIDINDIMTFTG